MHFQLDPPDVIREIAREDFSETPDSPPSDWGAALRAYLAAVRLSGEVIGGEVNGDTITGTYPRIAGDTAIMRIMLGTADLTACCEFIHTYSLRMSQQNAFQFFLEVTNPRRLIPLHALSGEITSLYAETLCCLTASDVCWETYSSRVAAQLPTTYAEARKRSAEQAWWVACSHGADIPVLRGSGEQNVETCRRVIAVLSVLAQSEYAATFPGDRYSLYVRRVTRICAELAAELPPCCATCVHARRGLLTRAYGTVHVCVRDGIAQHSRIIGACSRWTGVSLTPRMRRIRKGGSCRLLCEARRERYRRYGLTEDD